MIRAISILFAVAVVVTVHVGTSAAEVYRPWCAEYISGDGNNGTTCTFSSYDQCMLTARGTGALCIQNPWYQGRVPGTDGTAQGDRPRRR
jgi:hypothetical protein